ncbi:MAG TPA: hypothetical protein VNX68_16550 [Nitrosopumilaceae archaeon]|nr:hypothetical protein [Nitrosopumilaceae archaeon]
MNQSTAKETKKSYMYLGAISIMLLLSAAIIAPSLSAYADKGDPKTKSNDNKTKSKDNENHKSKDSKSHQKDRKDKDKGHKGPERCENGSSAKYNKHCDE